jgi:hypothetical protein
VPLRRDVVGQRLRNRKPWWHSLSRWRCCSACGCSGLTPRSGYSSLHTEAPKM